MEKINPISVMESMARFIRFVHENGKEPEYTLVEGRKCLKNDFYDVMKRLDNFMVTNRLIPKYINMELQPKENSTPSPTPVPTPPAPAPAHSGIYRTPKYRQYQDQGTNYWCGPFTLAQIIYELWGHEEAQSWLAQDAGTTTNGTDHNGLINAIDDWASIHGVTINSYWQNFSSTGWEQLGKYVEAPHIGIGIHCLYKNKWGHYIYPVEVNMPQQTITFVDSLNEEDVMTVSFATMQEWINNTPGNQPSVLVVIK
jgi:hypothetical protein